MAVRLGWRVSRLARRLRARVVRRLYVDRAGDESRAKVIAGTGRSGTTWVGELVASQAPCRVMFEPFHSLKIPALSSLRYFQYLRPHERHEVLLAYSRRVLRGEIRDAWVDRKVDVLFPQYRVIKEIRANLFLSWLRERFPRLPLLLVMRHPCAVVASRLQLDWATDTDIEPFLDQPRLVEDFLGEHLDVIRGASTPAAKHAVVWAVSYLVPLRQMEPEQLPVVFYEDLCVRPREVVPGMFAALDMPYDDSVYRRLEVPSTTTVHHSAIATGASRLERWRRVLTPRQVDEVLDVVRAFGLGHLYGEGPEPLTRNLAPPSDAGPSP